VSQAALCGNGSPVLFMLFLSHGHPLFRRRINVFIRLDAHFAGKGTHELK
jgi:hypothetical protein